MLTKELKIFLCICWIAFCLYKLVYEIIKDYKASKLTLKSTYPKLVQEILYYCTPIFKELKIKYYPLYNISYYKHKTRLGCYLPHKKKMAIYVNSHTGNESDRIRLIVKTTLHEIRHSQQHEINPDFKNYDIYTKKFTYQKNPFEIDSNAFADEHLNNCIKYLKQKKVLE